MSLELHIGLVGILSNILQSGGTVISDSAWRVLPIDSSETLKHAGEIGGVKGLTRNITANADVFISQYRLTCISKESMLGAVGVALSGGGAISYWFNADAKLENPNYNPVWGHKRGEAMGIKGVKILKPLEKEVHTFSSGINLYYGSDKIGSERVWGYGADKLFPDVLKVGKKEVKELYTKLLEAYKHQKPISYIKLYLYLSQVKRFREQLDKALSPEQYMKNLGLTSTP